MNYRPYRFPPLLVRARAELTEPEVAQRDDGQTSAYADAFEQGMARGYQEGLELGKTDGHAQGYADGLKSGAQDAREAERAHFATLAATLDAMIDGVRRLQSSYQQALRSELADLVAKVARRVIRCELALQPKQLVALIDESLGALPPSSEPPEIHLHPDERLRVEELMPARAAAWRLVDDARIEPGECHVKLGAHEVDAGCAHRLDACVQQIREQLAATPSRDEPEAT